MKALGAVLVVVVSCAAPRPAPQPTAPAAPPPPPAEAVAETKPAQTQPSIPDTPAGKTLSAWLDVFNAADEARAQTFVAHSKYPQSPGEMLAFHKRTGGTGVAPDVKVPADQALDTAKKLAAERLEKQNKGGRK
jgi:hypothetical protein